MALKILFILICSGLISSLAHASIFSTVEGIYKVVSCKNSATNPSPWDLTLCDNSQLSIQPSQGGTSFSFSKIIQSDVKVRSFDLPSNMALYPNGKYLEKGDFYAAFSNEDNTSGEIFIIRKKSENLYHLSMHRRSDIFKTFDMFEIDIEKIMDPTQSNSLKLKSSKMNL
ncbi:MAG: hypothetical protein ACXVCP_12815 [Bdellovibrio sp.]